MRTTNLALNIKNPRANELAAELVKLTGETKTQAVIQALRERLDRIRTKHTQKSQIEALRKIARECAALPVLDGRSSDEILGYDEDGLPT